jgi:hypothetical protein
MDQKFQPAKKNISAFRLPIIKICNETVFGNDVRLKTTNKINSNNSNKLPTRYNNFSVYYPDVCLQLNMFRAFSLPSSGAQWFQWQPLVLPSYRGDSRAVFVVGPIIRSSMTAVTIGPTTNTAQLSPRYESKTRGCHWSHWAPDDGRENAQNLLGCK